MAEEDPTPVIQRWLRRDPTVVHFEVANSEDTAVLIDVGTEKAYLLSHFTSYAERRT